MKRSLLNKDLTKQVEFIVEYSEQKEKAAVKPVNFSITPETLQNVKEKANVPKFKIKGKLDSSSCCLTKPFTGEVSMNNLFAHYINLSYKKSVNHCVRCHLQCIRMKIT